LTERLSGCRAVDRTFTCSMLLMSCSWQNVYL